MKRTISIISITILLVGMLLTTSCSEKQEDNIGQIKSLSDLKGKIVAAQLGSENAVTFNENTASNEADVVYVTSVQSGFSDLLAGKIDALVVDNVVAESRVNQHKNLLILDEKLDESPMAFAFQTGDPRRDEFNAVIKEMKDAGKIDKLFDKWMKEGASIDSELYAQNWEGSNGTISCAVDVEYEPICFEDENGNLQGMDIELLLKIAKQLDYKLKFTTVAFENLLSSVATGKNEIGASGLTVDEDREKMLDFTDEYCEASSVVVVRDLSKETNTTTKWNAIKDAFYRVFVEENRWFDLLKGFGMTIYVSMLSLLVGGLLGFILFLIFNKENKIINFILKKIIYLSGLMPGMIWLFIIYYIVYAGNAGNGFQAVITAFSLLFGLAVLAWLNYSVGLVDQGQKDAAYAMGYTKYQALFKLFIPQAMPEFIDMLEVEVVGIIKMTCLIELVSVMDVQAVADAILNETNVPFLPVVLPGIMYILFGGLMKELMIHIRAKLMLDKTNENIRKKIMRGKL